MRIVWRIFSRDLRRILRNPFSLVVTLGVAVIPSLYAWFNIIANWDPYANTGNIQVAVANNDTGATNAIAGRIDVGSTVVDQLKTNTQLGWRFVSESQAIEGVESGEYYAAIVIPDDFSSNLANAIQGGDERPTLDYYVNEKKNAIAPKITDTGASTIEEQIDHEFVATVANTIATTSSQLVGQAKDKTDAAQSDALSQLITVRGALGSASTSLNDLNQTVAQTRQTLDGTQSALDALTTATGDAASSLNQANALMATTRSSATTFANTMNDVTGHSLIDLGNVSASANAQLGTLTGGIVSAQGKADAVVTEADKLADANQKLIDQLNQIAGQLPDGDGKTSVQSAVGQLDAQNAVIKGALDALSTGGKDLSSTAESINKAGGTINTAVQQGVSDFGTMQNTVGGTVVPKLNTGLDSFATTSGQVQGLLAAVGPAVGQTRSVLDQLDGTLAQSTGAIDGTRSMLATADRSLGTAVTDLGAVDSSQTLGTLRDQLGGNASSIADFMGSPVTLETKPVYPVANYGSAVAPFYTNLALWVGGFVLIAIYKLEVDREGLADFGATQGYLGRGLLLAVVGLAQALIVCVGDLVLRIQCVSPLAFVGAGLFISFVYVNLIYALAIAFKHIGKALAVILVIMQIPGASGLYPIEMMPTFFQRLHPFLPFTYGINMMRGAIAGSYGDHYWMNMGRLALFLPVAWLIGILARPYLLNLNALFDRRLSQTELMVAETPSLSRERLKLTDVIRTLMGHTDYRRRLFRRVRQFDRLYPRLVTGGVAAIAVIPLVFLVLMLSTEAKIVMLSLWVGSIVLLCAFLIVIEYMHSTYERDLKIAGMKQEEFRRAVLERLDHVGERSSGGVRVGGVRDVAAHDDFVRDVGVRDGDFVRDGGVHDGGVRMTGDDFGVPGERPGENRREGRDGR